MDVTIYYKRIRETEAAIATPFVVVKSLRTEDGGKKGVLVEVPRYLAAKMAVEGSAEVVAAEVAEEFRQVQEAKFKAAKEASAVAKVDVTMVPSDEFKKLTDDVKRLKSGAKAAKD